MSDQAFWEKTWKEGNIPPVNAFAKRAWRDIPKKRAATLLDIGCGYGQDALYFARKGIAVTAIDHSSVALAHLREKAREEGLRITSSAEDIRRAKLGTARFDVIYAHLSLHYFTDEETKAIFAKLHQALKPRGLLLVKCKSVDDALYGKGKRIGEDTFSIKGHVRHFFSREYLLRQLQVFEILRARRTSSVYYTYKSSFVEAVARKR